MLNFNVCWIFAFFFTTFGTYAETPFTKTCGGEYELSFFSNQFYHDDAKRSCRRYGGSLVKIKSSEIQEAIENAVPIAKYYIGGYDKDRINVFYWDDGSRIPLRGETGYQNWNQDQPNEKIENCMLIGDHGKMNWFDTHCSEKRGYICQRGSSYVGTMTKSATTATCQSALTTVRWEKNSSIVQSTDTSLVHQTINPGGSVATLNFANPNISEAGTYTCVSTSPHCSVQRAVTVGDGTPAITQVANNICRRLFVTWRPTDSAIGFPHRIMVSNFLNESVFETPRNNQLQVTKISGLNFSTLYKVEVTACITTESCDTGFTARVDAETKSVLDPVTTTRLATAENGNCVTSWDKSNEATSYTVTIQCALDPNRSVAIISTLNKTAATNSMIFQPSPSRRCEVFIQAEGCGETSKPVKAEGICLTVAEEPDYVQTPVLLGYQNGNSYAVELQKPSENNGLISCLFVIICYGKCSNNNFKLEHLRKANETNVAGLEEERSSIAAAIPMTSFIRKQYFHILSKGNTTFCDVYNKGLPNSPTSSIETFRGQNIVANNSLNMSMFVVATTPSDGKVLLKSSAVVNFRSETKNADTVTESNQGRHGNTVGEQPQSVAAGNSGWTTGLAIGLTGIVVGIIGIVATVFIMRRRQSDVHSKPANETTDQDETGKASTTAKPQQQDTSTSKYENEPSASTYEEIKENKGAQPKEAATSARVQNQDTSPYDYENEPPAGAYEEMKAPGGNQDSGGYETFIA